MLLAVALVRATFPLLDNILNGVLSLWDDSTTRNERVTRLPPPLHRPRPPPPSPHPFYFTDKQSPGTLTSQPTYTGAVEEPGRLASA